MGHHVLAPQLGVPSWRKSWLQGLMMSPHLSCTLPHQNLGTEFAESRTVPFRPHPLPQPVCEDPKRNSLPLCHLPLLFLQCLTSGSGKPGSRYWKSLPTADSCAPFLASACVGSSTSVGSQAIPVLPHADLKLLLPSPGTSASQLLCHLSYSVSQFTGTSS